MSSRDFFFSFCLLFMSTLLSATFLPNDSQDNIWYLVLIFLKCLPEILVSWYYLSCFLLMHETHLWCQGKYDWHLYLAMRKFDACVCNLFGDHFNISWINIWSLILYKCSVKSFVGNANKWQSGERISPYNPES